MHRQHKVCIKEGNNFFYQSCELLALPCLDYCPSLHLLMSVLLTLVSSDLLDLAMILTFEQKIKWLQSSISARTIYQDNKCIKLWPRMEEHVALIHTIMNVPICKCRLKCLKEDESLEKYECNSSKLLQEINDDVWRGWVVGSIVLWKALFQATKQGS